MKSIDKLTYTSIEDSDFAHLCLKKIVFSHGTYFFFEAFIVGEIEEGINYSWELAAEVIDAAYDFYGANYLNLSYISNRINSYSVRPQDWLTFFKKNYRLNKIAYVSYTEISYANVIFEKIFHKSKLRRFTSLIEAIAWVSA